MKTKAKKTERKARPTLLNGTVPPPRVANAKLRPREYLTPKEVERLITAAKARSRRYKLRDATAAHWAENPLRAAQRVQPPRTGLQRWGRGAQASQPICVDRGRQADAQLRLTEPRVVSFITLIYAVMARQDASSGTPRPTERLI